MPAIKIKNKTDWDISFLKAVSEKLRPFVNLVASESYPFSITVVKKKDFYDRSGFDLDTHELTLKIDLTKQTKEDVIWVLVHEFAHFLSSENKELGETCLSKEHNVLEQILGKTFKINKDQVHEIFHDFLPAEVAANFFATMVTGKFHKRHPFSNVQKFLKNRKR